MKIMNVVKYKLHTREQSEYYYQGIENW